MVNLGIAQTSYPAGTGDQCCAMMDNVLTVFRLGETLGADGAEGRVFRATTGAGKDYAIKIYDQSYRAERVETLLKKLAWMVQAKDTFIESTRPAFAWPLALVYRGTDRNDLSAPNFIGFVMPLGDGLMMLMDLMERYRKHGVPTLTERMAMMALLASGFQRLHDGVVVKTPGGDRHITFAMGDVSEQNIRVAKNYMLFLIDCDGYIVRVDGEAFDQWTRTPEYSSPEYHEASNPKDYRWEAEDDNYGLAAITFRFLNNWHLPYRYKGATNTSKAAFIRARRFPFSARSADQVMGADAPLAAYRSQMDEGLKLMFDQVFLAGVGSRPSAGAWVQALKQALRRRPDLRERATQRWEAVQAPTPSPQPVQTVAPKVAPIRPRSPPPVRLASVTVPAPQKPFWQRPSVIVITVSLAVLAIAVILAGSGFGTP
jgi:DNA-binding helix-hairpin-helix protein with protein kinase domain